MLISISGSGADPMRHTLTANIICAVEQEGELKLLCAAIRFTSVELDPGAVTRKESP